ncbi:MAG: CBO0543 family protein, partial [Candidatus Bipolaricaulaceae bacterium]
SAAAVVISSIGILLIVRRDWKRYGALYLTVAIIGNIICYVFTRIGYYSFPFRLFPDLSIMPFTVVATFFPFCVILAFYFAPKPWLWKIPFYWSIIHVGMLLETIFEERTALIKQLQQEGVIRDDYDIPAFIRRTKSEGLV